MLLLSLLWGANAVGFISSGLETTLFPGDRHPLHTLAGLPFQRPSRIKTLLSE